MLNVLKINFQEWNLSKKIIFLVVINLMIFIVYYKFFLYAQLFEIANNNSKIAQFKKALVLQYQSLQKLSLLSEREKTLNISYQKIINRYRGFNSKIILLKEITKAMQKSGLVVKKIQPVSEYNNHLFQTYVISLNAQTNALKLLSVVDNLASLPYLISINQYSLSNYQENSLYSVNLQLTVTNLSNSS